MYLHHNCDEAKISATNIQHYKEFSLIFQVIFTSEDFPYSSNKKFAKPYFSTIYLCPQTNKPKLL